VFVGILGQEKAQVALTCFRRLTPHGVQARFQLGVDRSDSLGRLLEIESKHDTKLACVGQRFDRHALFQSVSLKRKPIQQVGLCHPRNDQELDLRM